MGVEEAMERYEPEPEFEEVKEEAMLDMSPADSKEFWLIQWIKDKNLDVPGFHGKELSLELHKDGNLGSLDSSSGRPYDLVSFAYQQPNATVFLPSGSEAKAVGKISRRVCLVRHREQEESEKPNLGSLTPSSKKSAEAELDHKNQLQIYAQRRGIQPPLYYPIQKGPPQKPRFKSKVVIDGLTFESPEEYHTLKAAERAAAKLAATSLPQEVPSISYKNILHELAQKEHYPFPCYNTKPNILNTPTAFISTVEIRGEIFEGEPGSSKKQVEMNAAKVAYQHFKEKRKGSDSPAPVLGGSEKVMQSAGQEIQSGEPGPSVPNISTVTCYKTNDSDAVGNISRGVCLVRHQGHEELEKPNFGSLTPSSKKSAGSSRKALAKKKKGSATKTLAKKKKASRFIAARIAKYCSTQGSALSAGAMSKEQTPEHDEKIKDESNVGQSDVSQGL